jgi:hypothetical protein
MPGAPGVVGFFGVADLACDLGGTRAPLVIDGDHLGVVDRLRLRKCWRLQINTPSNRRWASNGRSQEGRHGGGLTNLIAGLI